VRVARFEQFDLGEEILQVLSFSFNNYFNMPKAASARKNATPKHDPLATQLHVGELSDAGVLSQPGKRQKSNKKRHQEDEVSLPLL